MVSKSYGRGRSDLRLALRKRLVDGQFSLAVQPTLIVPTGSSKLSGHILIPGIAVGTTYDLSDSTQLYATPFVVTGRKVQGGAFIGINQSVSGPVGVSGELMFQHQQGETQSSVNFSATYTVDKNVELDTSANVGITRQTPALELVIGITRRF